MLLLSNGFGVSGLIDLALAGGAPDAAMAAYEATFGGGCAPGPATASRIFDLLRKEGRVADAVEVLTRVSESRWAHDSERSWALLQLQAHYQAAADLERALAAGWRLQTLVPPGDHSGKTSLKLLIAAVASKQVASTPNSIFSTIYGSFLGGNPGATDPARQILLAMELQREGDPDTASALFDHIANDTTAPQEDRATAMLTLQRLHLESGRPDQSLQTGLTIQKQFPENFGIRFASWRLMRVACPVGATGACQQQVEDINAALAEDLQSSIRHSAAPANHHAQSIMRQFNKERGIQ